MDSAASLVSMTRMLSSTLLFEGLQEEHLQKLAQHVRLRTYEASDIIVRETEEARGFFLVVSGRVKVFKISPDGRDQTIFHFGPGEPFCLCGLFENRSFMANAAALEDSEVLFIPAECLENMTENEPSLMFNLLFHMARRLKEALDLVETLTVKSLNERVALFLLKLVHSSEKADADGFLTVHLPMTHRELAKIVAPATRRCHGPSAHWRSRACSRSTAGKWKSMTGTP